MNPRDYLAGLEFHGIKLGLDNIRLLLDAASNPHRDYPVIHVAGTNGKGSVVAILDAILRAAGCTVGRFTSPHLIDVEERFLIDGVPMPADALDSEIAFFEGIAATMPNPPTYFELCTAIAFRWFSQKKVDIALIEVGMGGRFDSTNVVDPTACAITNIDLEHTAYLGTTVEAIAFEKAGIIKRNVPVVVAERQPAALKVILDRAAEENSAVLRIGADFHYALHGDPFAQTIDYTGSRLVIKDTPLALAGRYQGDNAATALALAELLMDPYPSITRDAVYEGLASVRWPCRMERVLDDPPVILDVAHNPAGMRRLAADLPNCVVVLAISADKAAAPMIEALDPVAEELILTQFAGNRATPVESLRQAAGSRPCRVADSLETAIAMGLAAASEHRPLVITGSIFTAGQARQILTSRYGAPPLRF
ncbi:MAG: dihydrofolate synthase [Candidatus Hydrogenedentota bacterium]